MANTLHKKMMNDCDDMNDDINTEQTDTENDQNVENLREKYSLNKFIDENDELLQNVSDSVLFSSID